MNILLINPPGKISFISPPLGLLYVSATLKNSGHKVIVIDYNLENLNREKLFGIIKENNIGLVGISIVTPKVYNAIELADHIKKEFSDLIIIAGGPHPTLDPKELLKKSPSFDYLVLGEGEYRTVNLINNLEKGLPVDNMEGIALRKNGEIINNPPIEFITDLNILPTPDRQAIDILEYSKLMKTSLFPATTMMTSRGCPYQCIYCSKPITGSRIRSLDPEKVIKEIEYLIKTYGIKEIIFYDDSFTINRERTIKICDLIIEKEIKIKWQCETRVNLVDKELLNKMRDAGCYIIAYGIESGNDRVLKILKKGITLEQIKEAVKITREAGIQIIGYFMLGIPGETEEEIKKTINFAKELEVDFAQFAIATAYPGTELYRIAREQNKITNEWSRSIYAFGGKPLASLSDVPIDTLYLYVKKAYRSFYFRPYYIFKKIISIKSLNDLAYSLRGLKTLIKEIIFS